MLGFPRAESADAAAPFLRCLREPKFINQLFDPGVCVKQRFAGLFLRERTHTKRMPEIDAYSKRPNCLTALMSISGQIKPHAFHQQFIALRIEMQFILHKKLWAWLAIGTEW